MPIRGALPCWHHGHGEEDSRQVAERLADSGPPAAPTARLPATRRPPRGPFPIGHCHGQHRGDGGCGARWMAGRVDGSSGPARRRGRHPQDRRRLRPDGSRRWSGRIQSRNRCDPGRAASPSTRLRRGTGWLAHGPLAWLRRWHSYCRVHRRRTDEGASRCRVRAQDPAAQPWSPPAPSRTAPCREKHAPASEHWLRPPGNPLTALPQQCRDPRQVCLANLGHRTSNTLVALGQQRVPAPAIVATGPTSGDLRITKDAWQRETEPPILRCLPCPPYPANLSLERGNIDGGDALGCRVSRRGNAGVAHERIADDDYLWALASDLHKQPVNRFERQERQRAAERDGTAQQIAPVHGLIRGEVSPQVFRSIRRRWHHIRRRVASTRDSRREDCRWRLADNLVAAPRPPVDQPLAGDAEDGFQPDGVELADATPAGLPAVDVVAVHRQRLAGAVLVLPPLQPVDQLWSQPAAPQPRLAQLVVRVERDHPRLLPGDRFASHPTLRTLSSNAPSGPLADGIGRQRLSPSAASPGLITAHGDPASADTSPLRRAK